MAILNLENLQFLPLLNLENLQKTFVNYLFIISYHFILENLQFLIIFNWKICKNTYLCVKMKNYAKKESRKFAEALEG